MTRQGLQQPSTGGNPLLSQKAFGPDLATNGAGVWTIAHLSAGIFNRTTVGAGYADTTPSADEIIAAMVDPQVGDSFEVIFRNTIAQAMTMAAGTGVVLGTSVDTAASLARTYLFTVLSNKRSAIVVASTTNASKILSNVRDDDIARVMPGMGVTGTGIGASAVVVGAALGVTTNAGTITVDVNSTATADNIAVTFTPQVNVRGISAAAI